MLHFPFEIGRINGTGTGTITQIPSFEGAFVTDGIDDLITSTKTVQEMLGGSNEITVVSMAHFIKGESNAPEICRINQIRRDTRSIRNSIFKIGKSGIFGYTYKNGVTTINNILGDKNDCTAEGNLDGIVAPFSVEGYYYNNNSNPLELCSIAWYWTIIANKVLTTDQINQVIAYFNLDRTLNPDILCNVKKQGITNENHAEFGDRLIDFSGNGRYIQLNNIAWKGDSGIGKYNFSNINIISSNRFEGAVTTNKCHFTKKLTNTTNNFCDLVVISPNEPIKFKVSGLSDGRKLFIANKSGSGSNYNFDNGEHEVSLSFSEGVGQNNPFGVTGDIGDIDVTVEFIPSHAGALCLDGVNDFGKVTGMPIYKDYTVIADYERFYLEPITGGRASILSKSSKVGDGSFIFNLEDQNGGKACYTFGEANGNISDDITRIIRYQSKYYNTKTLSIGTAEDNDFMVLGKVREVDSRYFCGAIYSLMTFPYSMSEFLIERQLKKHKLGTLYPDMVEFRPVIKSNASYDNIVFYYKNEKVENGTYLTVGSSIGMYIRLSSNPVNEIKSITINGIPATFKFHDANNNIYQYDFNLTSKSPQKINITIDEYIRYEDIVQPYPLFFEFTDENGNLISWGGKAKVGSTITRTKGVNYANLLEGLFTITNPRLNGVPLASSQHVVEKSMVFTCTATWAFDNNEPKCILSPRLLRIPNSSYKILGYIPDISGNGNNGAFTNFAFSGMSGAGGYVENFNDWIISKPPMTVEKTDSQAHISYIGTSYKTLPMFEYTNPKVVYNYTLIVEITGIPDGCVGKFIHVNTYTQEVANGINTIRFQNDAGWFGFTFYREDGVIIGDCNITIKQIGNYEGAICFDGIDDYVDIPSLSIGGKQVLMKTNWLKSPTLLYDQRASGSFAILTTKEDDATNPRIAYQARNQDGKTYIDGIENNYIETYSLKGITHNITVTNPSAGSGVVPVIGANTGKSSSFAKMALYDFMLFDEVSTDEEIKQLNDIVGIEGGYVQKPPYYWDAYGKTNSDEDRSTIQQRGTAVGDYDITNYNHAYEGMSGYNGYPAVFGTNKTYANLVPNDGNFILTSSHNIINVTKFDTSYGLLYSHIKLDGKLTSRNIDYPSYKIKVTGLGENFGLHYSYLESSSDTTVKGFEINNDGIYIIPKSFASDGSLTSNSDWIGFIFTGTAPESCNVTIEVLPEYENGLVYDGVDDYSENTSIPAFTDYTYIIKYEDLNNPNTGSCIQRKGSIKAGGGAFVQDHIYRGTKYQYNFGISSNIHKDDSIAFCTKTNYNGTAILSGNNTDNTGFTIGKFDGYRKMVFYKEMLYPRTVNMLTINMIKNMMAEDGIIDIQGKLFTDKFTGDFNLDFNKDFLIGN